MSDECCNFAASNSLFGAASGGNFDWRKGCSILEFDSNGSSEMPLEDKRSLTKKASKCLHGLPAVMS